MADVPLVTVFVPGPVVNPLNAKVGGLYGQRNHRFNPGRDQRRRARTAAAILLKVTIARYTIPLPPPALPKTVDLVAYTGNYLDEDGLLAAGKPLVDALVDAGVLHADRRHSGHTLRYDNVITRATRLRPLPTRGWGIVVWANPGVPRAAADPFLP